MTTRRSIPRSSSRLRERAGEFLEPDTVRTRTARSAWSVVSSTAPSRLVCSKGALAALEEAGVDRADISVSWVPGAFEIPLVALAYADAARPYDAVITLGAVIRGDTGHYELVAGECARGVQDVQLSTRVPVDLWRAHDQHRRAGARALSKTTRPTRDEKRRSPRSQW